MEWARGRGAELITNSSLLSKKESKANQSFNQLLWLIDGLLVFHFKKKREEKKWKQLRLRPLGSIHWIAFVFSFFAEHCGAAAINPQREKSNSIHSAWGWGQQAGGIVCFLFFQTNSFLPLCGLNASLTFIFQFVTGTSLKNMVNKASTVIIFILINTWMEDNNSPFHSIQRFGMKLSELIGWNGSSAGLRPIAAFIQNKFFITAKALGGPLTLLAPPFRQFHSTAA